MAQPLSPEEESMKRKLMFFLISLAIFACILVAVQAFKSDETLKQFCEGKELKYKSRLRWEQGFEITCVQVNEKDEILKETKYYKPFRNEKSK